MDHLVKYFPHEHKDPNLMPWSRGDMAVDACNRSAERAEAGRHPASLASLDYLLSSRPVRDLVYFYQSLYFED